MTNGSIVISIPLPFSGREIVLRVRIPHCVRNDKREHCHFPKGPKDSFGGSLRDDPDTPSVISIPLPFSGREIVLRVRIPHFVRNDKMLSVISTPGLRGRNLIPAHKDFSSLAPSGLRSSK